MQASFNSVRTAIDANFYIVHIILIYTYMHVMVHGKFTIVMWECPLCEVSKFNNNSIANNAD